MLSEEQILEFWDEKKIFQKSIDQRPTSENFVFYDGPPFATGLPHYGHILVSTIKDLVPRFWTMKGKRIERRWGWDCHGLPIENIIEQKLKFKTRKDILDLGVKRFNEECRKCVLQYAQDWKKTIRRLGRWVDMENDYKTMDLSFMESIWWVFKTLWEKKMIYEGRKSMHICPRCETVLSNFEVTQGYKEVEDYTVYPLFKMTTGPYKGASMVAWTTTAWTLPGNTLLAIHPTSEYVVVSISDAKDIIVAKTRLESLKTVDPNNAALWKVKRIISADELIGSQYEPLFPTYKNHANAFRVVTGDFVSLEEGTGVVHIAPGFGEDDMMLGQREKVDPIMHVQMDGMFVPEVIKTFQDAGFDVSKLTVKPKANPRQTDGIVDEYLSKHGKILGAEPFKHSYPHCWRCDTPLLNYSTTSWFVSVTALKEKMLANNQNIHWVPEHIKDGRFGKWLEGARDWAISRSRFWGTPLPIWRAPDGEILCIGSVEELEKFSGITVNDLHKDVVDDIVIQKNGKTFRRIPEVLDCWFESGSMPYAQMHYPFENKELFTQNFPAEFIGESQDQTRAWFYTLHVLSTALFDSSAFRNVIVNGIILAEDGKKMSKKLKNYPDPEMVMDKYGADALRMYLCLSPLMEAESLNFSEKGVDEVYKKVTMLAGNVLKFWELYAPNMRDAAPRAAPASEHVLDQWIVDKTRQLVTDVGAALETYRIQSGARPIVEFLQNLSTWYVRRSRDRFKQDNEDKTNAVQTLGWTLRQLSIALAPFMPMLAEGIYQALKSEQDKESVHLTDWPDNQNYELRITNYKTIVEQMEMVRRFASIAHQKRAEAGIKVRQPLQSITIRESLAPAYQELLRDEVNIKQVIVDAHQPEELILDTSVSAELKEEGLVRDLVRLINAARKAAGFTINDRVSIRLQSDLSTIPSVIQHHDDAIKQSTLADDLQFTPKLATTTTTTLDGSPIDIVLEKQ